MKTAYKFESKPMNAIEKTIEFLHTIEMKFQGFPITVKKAKQLRMELEEVQRELEMENEK